MKCTPFDLEKALAGQPLITSSGKEVKRIAYFPERSAYKIVALIGDCFRLFNDSGQPFADGYVNDPTGALCMAPMKKTLFVAVYRGMSGDLFTGQKLHTEVPTGFDPTVPKASNFVGMYPIEIEG